MMQILESHEIRLYCRNGTPYDWANTILRIALFAQPEDDYPVTYIRNHPNYVIVTDKDGEFKGYFSPKDYQEALARINYPQD